MPRAMFASACSTSVSPGSFVAQQAGLNMLDALNRCSDYRDIAQTVHLMKYIFPRQFKLHNAFTSKVDSTETTYAFRDYTLREQEIRKVEELRGTSKRVRVPKRLRGAGKLLIAKLQRLHSRCSYTQLLKHYCHSQVSIAPNA